MRDATKFHRMIAFSRALPRIRAACRRDLARTGLPREKVLALCVRLLDLTHIRVGNEEYARANHSYGLTTLRNRHVQVRGAAIRFQFRGKSGKTREVALHDRRLARVVAQCSELPGQELFQYVAEDGTPRAIASGDVNEYLATIAGDGFTAKDFRTWAGTVLALRTLGVSPPLSGAAAARAIVSCVKAVAAHLGNTPAVCKRSYIHPAVFEAYRQGWLAPDRSRRRSEDAAVAKILSRAASLTEGEALVRALRASLTRPRA